VSTEAPAQVPSGYLPCPGLFGPDTCPRVKPVSDVGTGASRESTHGFFTYKFRYGATPLLPALQRRPKRKEEKSLRFLLLCHLWWYSPFPPHSILKGWVTSGLPVPTEHHEHLQRTEQSELWCFEGIGQIRDVPPWPQAPSQASASNPCYFLHFLQ